MKNTDSQENESITLHEAARIGNTARIESLLNEGVDINSRDSDRDTALMRAALVGNLEVVKYLLAHGADPDLQNNYYWTALMIASLEGHFEEVRCLVEHGANMNLSDINGDTALTIAEVHGKLEISEYLVKAGAQRLDVVAWQDKIEQNSIALLEAAGTGDFVKVKALLSDGVDINFRRDYERDTALTLAVEGGYLEMVELLIEYGANVNLQNHDLNTPIILALGKRRFELMKYLTEKGANLDLLNVNSHTLLMIATLNGDIERVKYLVGKGANIDLINDNHETALIYTVYAEKKNRGVADICIKQLEIAQCLIEAGAHIDVKLLKTEKEKFSAIGELYVINLLEKVVAYRNGISTLTEGIGQRFANGLKGNPYYKDYAKGYNNLSVYIPEELKEKILDAIPDRHSQKLVRNPSMLMLNSWVEEIKEERSKLQLSI
ncbi:ankyrin repeat domain-containing protein [Candidatus Jidaibacter acanthamoebae]|nr:ankyrin repeat domain-containing protein [Candidatus Jidaibacter acanthamoeba]